MNDQQIYTLIARTPGIRATEVADALGADLKEVSEKLRFLVELGDVVRSRGFTPEGSPAQVYELSEQFKVSPMGMTLPASLEAESASAAPTPVPPVAPASAPSDEPVAEVKPGKEEPGRAARALAYIAAVGSATDAQLRVVMGLPDDVYPSSYLTKDAQAGKVVKIGREWKIGDGVPLRPLPRQPAFGAPLGLPGASPFDVPAPPAPKAKHQATATPAPAPDLPADPVPAVPAFRCGLWSDGTLEMQRDGVTVAAVHEDEAETLLNFLDRVRPAKEAA
jgi:hypothetical protein